MDKRELAKKWLEVRDKVPDESDLNIFIVDLYNVYKEIYKDYPYGLKYNIGTVLTWGRWEKLDFLDDILFVKESILNVGDRVELTRDIKQYKKGDKFRVIKDLGIIVEVIHEKDFIIMKAGKYSRDFRKIEKGLYI